MMKQHHLIADFIDKVRYDSFGDKPSLDFPRNLYNYNFCGDCVALMSDLYASNIVMTKLTYGA